MVRSWSRPPTTPPLLVLLLSSYLSSSVHLSPFLFCSSPFEICSFHRGHLSSFSHNLFSSSQVFFADTSVPPLHTSSDTEPRYTSLASITGMRGAKAGVRPQRRSPPCIFFFCIHAHRIVRVAVVVSTVHAPGVLGVSHSEYAVLRVLGVLPVHLLAAEKRHVLSVSSACI